MEAYLGLTELLDQNLSAYEYFQTLPPDVQTVLRREDGVSSFEELQALLDSRDIDVTSLEETPMEDATYFGRVLARTGGLSEAVSEALREQGLEEFDLRPEVCDGIEACRVALLKKSKNLLAANFVEGMACSGGCIGGAGCLMHGEKNRSKVDLHGKDAKKQRLDE